MHFTRIGHSLIRDPANINISHTHYEQLADMTHTHEIISEKYGGPLIPLEAVAEILGRKPNSIRILLKRSNGDQDLADRLRQCQAKLGRRLLFRASDIARMIDEA